MTKLIRSNRTLKDFQPQKTVSISDLEKDTKLVKSNKNKSNDVTFDTSMRISNHTRNKLVALATLGYTSSQKNAIELLFNSFRDQLDTDSKKELDFQIKTLERRDARLKG